MLSPKRWLLTHTPLYFWHQALLDIRYCRVWKGDGTAPRKIKEQTVREYGRRFNLKTLIETGTYLGQMVRSQRRRFERIISVELSAEFTAINRYRFRHASNVQLIQGDSGTVLRRILESLNEPALFWLDAHYSGGRTARGATDTPIEHELQHIFSHKFSHVVLVDDARLFGRDPSYPTIESVKERVKALRPGHSVTVVDDIIRIHGPVS